jgi:SAM-dependent methyltransferase
MVERRLSSHDAHARRCAPDDFWGQVRRTVGGRPVDEHQITMIEDAIRAALQIIANDVVLDLCCGNGALSNRIFACCRGGVGVDSSPFLIDVARRHFERAAEHVYILGDIEDYVATSPDPHRFTKALCYGSLQYLSRQAAASTLRALRRRFSGVSRLLIGNLPDRALLAAFYRAPDYVPGIEDDCEAPLGIWRTTAEFARLAAATGWHAEFSRMPSSFYAAHYRYDAVLTPNPAFDRLTHR